jgi:hypothetical protein
LRRFPIFKERFDPETNKNGCTYQRVQLFAELEDSFFKTIGATIRGRILNSCTFFFNTIAQKTRRRILNGCTFIFKNNNSKKKKRRIRNGCTFWELPVASEAIAAQDGSVGTRLERYLASFSALRANCIVHLAGGVVTVSAAIAGTAASGSALTSNPAGLAALRFVRKAFFGEKFLLVGSKGKFLSAIFADDGLVAVH